MNHPFAHLPSQVILQELPNEFIEVVVLASVQLA